MLTDIEPVPAATVALVRANTDESDLEVLLLRRSQHLVFHGGHWVFPGGRVDAGDFARAEGRREYPAARLAAVRETREEAGIDLDPSRLIHIAHWTTPPQLPRRFCTWFFLYVLNQEVSVRVDNKEIMEYRWLRPRQALAEAARERLDLPAPTTSTVRGLARHRNVNSLLACVNDAAIHVFPERSVYYRPQEMGCD